MKRSHPSQEARVLALKVRQPVARQPGKTGTSAGSSAPRPRAGPAAPDTTTEAQVATATETTTHAQAQVAKAIQRVGEAIEAALLEPIPRWPAVASLGESLATLGGHVVALDQSFRALELVELEGRVELLESAGGGKEVWVCQECGWGVAADEDGCCATCGEDCAVKLAIAAPQ